VRACVRGVSNRPLRCPPGRPWQLVRPRAACCFLGRRRRRRPPPSARDRGLLPGRPGPPPLCAGACHRVSTWSPSTTLHCPTIAPNISNPPQREPGVRQRHANREAHGRGPRTYQASRAPNSALPLGGFAVNSSHSTLLSRCSNLKSSPCFPMKTSPPSLSLMLASLAARVLRVRLTSFSSWNWIAPIFLARNL